MPAFDLICLSHLRWDYVYQRPQHLLSRCTRFRRVLFIEEPQFGGDAPHIAISTPQPGITRAVLHLPEHASDQYVTLQRQMLDDLITQLAFRDYALLYYTPMALSYTRHLTPLATVYDCMDELSAFVSAPPGLREREAELFDRADLVFTGGHSLYRAKRAQHPRVYPLPSSVDTAHFAQARHYLADPINQAPIPHPRIGFYGVVDERLDLDLIGAVAQARPAWHLVIIGPCAKINQQRLPHGANVHYLGLQAYADLPRYLSGWDAACMPFANNAATKYISPTKTLEFLAAGIPVVSTAITDVVQPYGTAGLVRIATTPADFITALDAALTEDRGERIQRNDACLEHMSWDRTWRQMHDLLAGVIADNQVLKSLPILTANEIAAPLATLVIPTLLAPTDPPLEGYVASGGTASG